MEQEQLLADIRILNEKKTALNEEIKKLDFAVREREEQRDKMNAENQKLSDDLKILRQESNEAKSDLTQIIKNSKNERERIQIENSEIDEKIKACESAETRAKHEQEELALQRTKEKELLGQIEDKKQDLKSIEEATTKAIQALNEKQDEIDSKIQANQYLIENHDLFVKELEESKTHLNEEREKVVEDWKRVNAKEAEVSSRERDIVSRETEAKEVKDLSEQAILANKAKLEDIASQSLALEREKDALESQKNEVERDRLRVLKLAKDKDVEKELAELRQK